jgi:hypothetical protein
LVLEGHEREQIESQNQCFNGHFQGRLLEQHRLRSREMLSDLLDEGQAELAIEKRDAGAPRESGERLRNVRHPVADNPILLDHRPIVRMTRRSLQSCIRGLQSMGCLTSSVAQANLTIKINFNILRSLSSSDILTICLHAFLQSFRPFEKNCVQGLPRDFRQNNPNTNKKFRWSFSAISHQPSFDVAEKENVRGCQI